LTEKTFRQSQKSAPGDLGDLEVVGGPALRCEHVADLEEAEERGRGRVAAAVDEEAARLEEDVASRSPGTDVIIKQIYFLRKFGVFEF
jgi:hypothetical protein